MDKVKKEQCGNSNCKIYVPTYTATVGEGYIQSSCCDYYYGTAPRVEFGKDKYGLITLVNPRNSGVLIYMNKLSCANYSNSPISVQVFTMATILGEIKESDYVAAGNNGCCCGGKGEIYYGNDNNVRDGIQVYSRSVPAYETSDGYPNGSIILQPGTTRVYLMKAINPKECALANLSFAWWEEYL